MNSNRSALDALAQEGILLTEDQLLRETRKVRSNGNGANPAKTKGQVAYYNGTSPSITAVKSKPGSGPTQVGEARSLPAAEIALDQQPGIAIAPDQRAMDTPAVLRKPTSIPRDLGEYDGDLLVGSLAIIGGIAGAILVPAVSGEGEALFGGAFVGVMVGYVISMTINALLWRIGVHEDEADCRGCGRKLDPTLYVCLNCATPVKHQLGIPPVKLTPSDHVLLNMVPKPKIR